MRCCGNVFVRDIEGVWSHIRGRPERVGLELARIEDSRASAAGSPLELDDDMLGSEFDLILSYQTIDHQSRAGE